MVEQETVVQVHYHRCISWSAIFIGALTALGLAFLLNLFGFAIGLSAFKAISNGSISLALGGMLGIIAGIIISMLLAGYVSGYLGRLNCLEHRLGIVYGFTTWVMALVLGAAVIGVLSQNVAAYTNAISNTVVAVPVNQISTPVGSTSISTPKSGQKAVVQVNVTPNNLASGAFMVFLFFFIGALFTCIGASWGMRAKRLS